MKFRIDLKILFFLALFYFTHQLNLYILVMIFCFLHECAHLAVGYILGFKPKKIEIMPLGFVADIDANIDDYNKKIGKSNIVELKKIFIDFAGPLLNLVFIVILIFLENKLLFMDGAIGIDKINLMIYSNLIIFLFNIIPIYPLDGGRVIKSCLKIWSGSQKANEILNIVSNVSIILITAICSVIILYIKNIAILFIIIYLWILVHKENKKYELKKRVYEYLNV